ncbi:hypothetical protein TRFO_17397 [Tritrichomonas foetus]|uniref:Uncharacterized protein n=1 Tax=Tritrichomonas foetus TaxID=1144522 RepID=A0A1J4KMZ8_9EUKA|nr:hypothetical protein TRFO_17397 [Tritrichomonas foetus]|eukprot:OHT12689.1 hypothetical protein TRFO_17397 [Tritrichomonas foetus]
MKHLLSFNFDDFLTVNPHLPAETQSSLQLNFGTPTSVPVAAVDPPLSPTSSMAIAGQYVLAQQKKGFINQDVNLGGPNDVFKAGLIPFTFQKKKETVVIQTEVKRSNEEKYLDFWLELDCVTKIKKEMSILPFNDKIDNAELISRLLDITASVVRVMKHEGKLETKGKSRDEIYEVMHHFVQSVRDARFKLISAKIEDNSLDYSKLTQDQKNEFKEFAHLNINDDKPKSSNSKEKKLNASIKLPLEYLMKSYNSIDSEDLYNQNENNHHEQNHIFSRIEEEQKILEKTSKALPSLYRAQSPAQVLTATKRQIKSNLKKTVTAMRSALSTPISNSHCMPPSVATLPSIPQQFNAPQKPSTQNTSLLQSPDSTTNFNNTSINTTFSTSINAPINTTNNTSINTLMNSTLSNNYMNSSSGGAYNSDLNFFSMSKPGSRNMTRVLATPTKKKHIPSQSTNRCTYKKTNRNIKFQQEKNSSRFWMDEDPLKTRGPNSNFFHMFDKLIAPIHIDKNFDDVEAKDPFTLTTPEEAQELAKNYFARKQKAQEKENEYTSGEKYNFTFDIDNQKQNNKEKEGDETEDHFSLQTVDEIRNQNAIQQNQEKTEERGQVDVKNLDFYNLTYSKCDFEIEPAQRYTIPCEDKLIDLQFLNERTKVLKQESGGNTIYEKLLDIWDTLGFSVFQKLQMVVKYSENIEVNRRLDEALNFWEQAYDIVKQYQMNYRIAKDFLKSDVMVARNKQMAFDTIMKDLSISEESVKEITKRLRAAFGDELIIHRKKSHDTIRSRRFKLKYLLSISYAPSLSMMDPIEEKSDSSEDNDIEVLENYV